MDNSVTIGGRKYDFGFLPAMESVFLQIDIVKTIGEPLFKAFMTAQEGDLTAEQAGGMLIGLLSANLDPALIQKNLLIVFKYVFCDGKRVTNLDETFTGHPMELWEVFAYAIRYQYHDFFDGALFNSIRTKMATTSKSLQ
jgi:hypothetical protein